MSESGSVRKRAKVEIADEDLFSHEWDDAMIAYNQQLRMMEGECGSVSELVHLLTRALDGFRAGGVMAGVIQTCIRSIRDASDRNQSAMRELTTPVRETVARAALLKYTEGLPEARDFVQKLIPAIPSQEECDRHASAAVAVNQALSASFLRTLPVTLRRFLGEKSIISVTSRPIQEEVHPIRPKPIRVEEKKAVIELVDDDEEAGSYLTTTVTPEKKEKAPDTASTDPIVSARCVNYKNFCHLLLEKLQASFPWRVYFQTTKKKSGGSGGGAEWAIITDTVPILDPAPIVYFVFQIPTKDRSHTMFFNEFRLEFGKLYPHHKSMMTLKRLLVSRAGNDAVLFEQVVPDNVLQFMDSTALTIFLEKDLSPYTNASFLIQTTDRGT